MKIAPSPMVRQAVLSAGLMMAWRVAAKATRDSLFLPVFEPSALPAITGAAPRSRLACIEMVHGAAGQHPLRRRSKLLEPPEIRREFRFVLLAGVAPCLSGVPDHRQGAGIRVGRLRFGSTEGV
jgi:hypothetical protein